RRLRANHRDLEGAAQCREHLQQGLLGLRGRQQQPLAGPTTDLSLQGHREVVRHEPACTHKSRLDAGRWLMSALPPKAGKADISGCPLCGAHRCTARSRRDVVDELEETPNSFSMSAIIGRLKPALRNSAKSSAMTRSHSLASCFERGLPL